MLNADIIVVLLSVLTVCVIPACIALFRNFKANLFLDLKQTILDYYATLDSGLDRALENDRFLKGFINHYKELQELKMQALEKRLSNLETHCENILRKLEK